MVFSQGHWWWASLLCLVWLGQAQAGVAITDESYNEDLRFTQLPDGKVLSEFKFIRRIGPLALAKVRDNHYSLLPRSVGEIVQTFGVEELHLTFTQGTWNHQKWGYSPLGAAAGVQLWSWFNTSSVDKQWKGLTHALAGLFCASLNQIDQSNTAQPLLSFLPEGDYGEELPQDVLELRYGSLPHEAVCTENLTPWTKLLPCQTQAGIASLFNAYRLFDGHYHSMGTHIRPIITDDAGRGMEFVQTLSVVLNPLRLDNRKDWSLSSLFERKIASACALASDTKVVVTVPSHPASTLNSPPLSVLTDSHERLSAHYNLDLSTPKDTDFGVTWEDSKVDHGVNRSRWYIDAHRYQTGYGGERGGLAVDLRNHHPTADLDIIYFEAIPWYLKLYLHTLRAETAADASHEIIKDMYYQPAIDRGRPAVLEMKMTLPANSTTTLHLEFDKAYIKYTEHPPDANRGFDIGAAVITFTAIPESPPSPHDIPPQVRIHTETVLVSLPTPDFSMPYNVITLTCTLMALYFGSVFNMLTRQYQPVIVKG
ncbi:hypothetical protein PhCBS80983_g05531 [Powellomyces hirtus]|uniref:Phosphatidylinositol glycan, class T n=1 Tax=Powellomyces hirtus TaxID=109895 RepID=A0A507DV79_9FUNG|nr:GPI transamidase component PIG-T [Powellomyces hirtus]TPX55192.1 hypothetical protein PhCBS80983_g05531 [Powellomyces hirtus]